MMRRRDVFTLLGGAAAAWPLAARAQQTGKVHRIGFLGSATAAGSAKAVESLRTGLREFGYVEGTNIGIEFRWAEGIYDRLPHLVAELIATNVDVLITHGTPGTRVAKQATTTIPIVMAISGDAIATGLVSSLARPEANLTGSTFFLPQLNAAQGGVSAHLPPGRALKSRQSCQQTDHSSDAGRRRTIEFDSRSRPGAESQRVQSCFRCHGQEPRRLGRGYRGRGICC
jgi:ABC transporter substrate binding protein